MPIIACPERLNDCQCDDDPIRNFSAELPDSDTYIGLYDFTVSGGVPPFSGTNLGNVFRQQGCFAICYSEVSQLEADLCALAQAQLCSMDSNNPTRDPDGNPVQIFGNHANSCRVRCSDYRVCQPGECLGDQTFTWTVNPNTIYALSQVLADRLAYETACQQAKLHIICISTTTLLPGCVDSTYRQQLSAHGGVPFNFLDLTTGCSQDAAAGDRVFDDPVPYMWTVVAGSLPAGLELRECTGIIKGTPTAPGTYTFTVQATDAIGSYQTQQLTMCVLSITNTDPLADAPIGTAYSVQLLETPGDIGSEVWELVSGSLPPGLTMSVLGVISGTPTGSSPGEYVFTVRVTTVCA